MQGFIYQLYQLKWTKFGAKLYWFRVAFDHIILGITPHAHATPGLFIPPASSRPHPIHTPSLFTPHLPHTLSLFIPPASSRPHPIHTPSLFTPTFLTHSASSYPQPLHTPSPP